MPNKKEENISVNLQLGKKTILGYSIDLYEISWLLNTGNLNQLRNHCQVYHRDCVCHKGSRNSCELLDKDNSTTTWVVSIVLGRGLFPVNTQLGNHCLVPLTVLKVTDATFHDTHQCGDTFVTEWHICTENKNI